MASKAPLADISGYKNKAIAFSIGADHDDILLDIAYPDTEDTSDCTVLLHYHGGFLIFGDRFSFLPHWLINASVARKWVFVTPGYRLIPEGTAHDSSLDALKAYEWVLEDLHKHIGRRAKSVLLAGSSAGGYLALTTAKRLGEGKRLSGLLLIYGMLDPTDPRYLTPGTNVFGLPKFETEPVLAKFPISKEHDERRKISAYVGDGDLTTSPRGEFMSALHLAAKFPDYLTGVEGLTQSIAAQGVAAIPTQHQVLFPLSFKEGLEYLPPTFLLHGKNDSGVPVSLSNTAAEKLKAAGVEVHTEFPDDAEHGFDVRSGNIDVEKEGDSPSPVFQVLKKAVDFLDGAAKSGPGSP